MDRQRPHASMLSAGATRRGSDWPRCSVGSAVGGRGRTAYLYNANGSMAYSGFWRIIPPERSRTVSNGVKNEKEKPALSGSFCFFPELGLFDISLCSFQLTGKAAAAEAKKSQPALILPEARDLRHETSQ